MFYLNNFTRRLFFYGPWKGRDWQENDTSSLEPGIGIFPTVILIDSLFARLRMDADWVFR